MQFTFILRTAIVASLLVARLVFPGGDTLSNAAERFPLRVLCYNIHYGQGTDGRYDLERLATVINKAKPELVALQEVDVGVKRSGRIHQARRLVELTGMRCVSVQRNTTRAGCMGALF